MKHKPMVSIALISLFLAKPAARSEEPVNPLDKAPSRFAKLDDIRVHYKSLGTAPTALVFIHGWTADLTCWRYQVPAFDGKVRMVLIDLPGHGQSDKPKIDYTMELFARAVDAVLKEAGVESAILAGHSMGTPVVRQFYRLFPKKTKGLVAVDGALRPFTRKPEEIEKFVASLSGADFKANHRRFIESMFTEQTSPEVRKLLTEILPTAPQYVAVSAMREMFDPAIWKDDSIDVPVLATMAKRPSWSADYESYVRKLAPQVDYQVMEGVGHFLLLEKPAAFNEILAGFLRKQKLLKR